MKKRVAIYTFYEAKGIVRTYVTIYLKALFKVAEKVIVVVNGGITDFSRLALENLGCEVLQRANHGLDFGAWRHALEKLGERALAKYDELILCNCSCYGPAYPFEKVFEKMDEVICDFWGLTRHQNTNSLMIPSEPKSVVIQHIQSYFMVFRNQVINSQGFKTWWKDMIEYDDFHQEVAYHEIKFTKYLEDYGFKSATFIPCEKYWKRVKGENILYLFQIDMLSDDHMPLIKRKIFAEYRYFFENDLTQKPKELLNFLKKTKIFPIDVIWEDLLATYSISVLKQSLVLHEILSSQSVFEGACEQKFDLACICYGYYKDHVNTMLDYIKNMPSNSTVYIVSSRQDTLDEYQRRIVERNLQFKNVLFRLKTNLGCDASAYLISCVDVFQKHDLICCIHDKKSKQLTLQQTAEDYAYYCLDCCLASKEYVLNVIKLFADNPRLGLACAPTIYYGPFTTIGGELNANQEIVKVLYQKLDLSIPFDECHVFSLGSAFWVRKGALNSLSKFDWKYEDLPDEPLPVDSTVSHAIERIYPLVVQNEGYFTLWITSDFYEANYMNNVVNMLRMYNQVLFLKFGGISCFNKLSLIYKELARHAGGIDIGSIGNLSNMSTYEQKKLQKKIKLRLTLYEVKKAFSFTQKRKQHYEKKLLLMKNILALCK